MCVSRDTQVVYAHWFDWSISNYLINAQQMPNARTWIQGGGTSSKITALRDYLALVVAEGGSISKEILRDVIEKYSAQEGLTLTTVYSSNDLALGYKAEDIPEYHEWLVMQAQKELVR